MPCTLLVVAAIVVLGPPLGRLLNAGAGRYAFLPNLLPSVHPEPTEHARYVLALGAPVLLSLAALAVVRLRVRLPARAAARGAHATQGLLAGVLAACIVVQYHLRYGHIYTQNQGGGILTLRYFTPATLLVAALIAAGALVALRNGTTRRLGAALLRESRARRVAAATAAVLATAIWLLQAVHTDESLAAMPFAVEDVAAHLEFTIDEAFAVVNGLTPLVNFTAPYASLWPYLSALALVVFGRTVLVFTTTMCVLTALALLAIFGVLRRAARSATAALLLYLPFLATSVFLLSARSVYRSSAGSYFANFPLRYAGPFLLAWLTARQLERGGAARGTFLLFTAAGLTVLNNGDFGIPALGATLAALLWTAAGARHAPWRQLVRQVAGGLATAFALVSLLTLVRAGSLPRIDRLVDYAGIFSVGGINMMPINGILGLHMAIYLTYVVAIATATARALRGAENRVLTGMLAWSGVFGLGAAFYWVGRSHPVALKYGFASWALALVLLSLVVVRQLAATRARRPTIAAVAVLFGFGVLACSLAQATTPWSQIERLETKFRPTPNAPYAQPLAPSTLRRTRAFVMSLADGPSRFVVRRGAPVAILVTTGHRIADAYGIRNVSPFIGETVLTVQQVDAVIDTLRKAGGNTIILPDPLVAPSMFPVLERRGFRLVTHSGLRRYRPNSGIVLMPWLGRRPMRGVPAFVMKWVDTHHLHPRALAGR